MEGKVKVPLKMKGQFSFSPQWENNKALEGEFMFVLKMKNKKRVFSP